MNTLKKMTIYGLHGHFGKLPQPWADIAPLVEIDYRFKPSVGMIKHESAKKLSEEELIPFFQGMYNFWNKFGPFGDVMSITEVEQQGTYLYLFNYLGRLSFLKPGIAADLVVFVKDSAGQSFFVGIKRKYDPGKGKAALIGGFRDIKGYHIDTPLQTIIEESHDEAGIIIDTQDDYTPYSHESIPVRIGFTNNPDTKNFGELAFLGIFPTSKEEEVYPLGLKRVYETAAYLLMIDVSYRLNKETADALFSSGDDAENIFVSDLKDMDTGSFGISHHGDIFSKALSRFHA